MEQRIGRGLGVREWMPSLRRYSARAQAGSWAVQAIGAIAVPRATRWPEGPVSRPGRNAAGDSDWERSRTLLLEEDLTPGGTLAGAEGGGEDAVAIREESAPTTHICRVNLSSTAPTHPCAMRLLLAS